MRLPVTAGLCALLCVAIAGDRALAQQLDPNQTQKNIDAYITQQKREAAANIPGRRKADEPQTPDTRPMFKLTGVSIEGATVFTPDDFAGTYEGFIGTKVSQADLAKITEAISELYRDADFHLSRAIIPPQDIQSGHIRIQILEGRIDEIVLKGVDAEMYAVRWLLAPVSTEHPSKLSTLERALLLAHDVPGVHIKDTEMEEIGVASGKFRLIVHLETWQVYSSLALDNRGTSDVGPLQGYLVSAFNSVFRPADSLGLDLSANPDGSRELAFGRVSYEMPFGFNGSRIGGSASYNEIRPGDERRFVDTVTRTKNLEANVSRALRRTRKSSLWATAALGISDVREGDDLGRTYSDHIRTVSLIGNYELHDKFDGANYLTVTVTDGVDIFGASDKDDLQLSTVDGDPDFTKLDFFFTRYQKISDAWSLSLTAGGQWASTALLSSEEFYIGGPIFGRGYDGGELSGDQGLAGSVEVRFDEEIGGSRLKGYQLYAFADRAIVRSYLDGKDDTDALTSAGGGVRVFLAGDLQANFEVAVPLDYRSLENPDRDPRVFFSLTKAFKLCPRKPRMRCGPASAADR